MKPLKDSPRKSMLVSIQNNGLYEVNNAILYVQIGVVAVHFALNNPSLNIPLYAANIILTGMMLSGYTTAQANNKILKEREDQPTDQPGITP